VRSRGGRRPAKSLCNACRNERADLPAKRGAIHVTFPFPVGHFLPSLGRDPARDDVDEREIGRAGDLNTMRADWGVDIVDEDLKDKPRPGCPRDARKLPPGRRGSGYTDIENDESLIEETAFQAFLCRKRPCKRDTAHRLQHGKEDRLGRERRSHDAGERGKRGNAGPLDEGRVGW